jgi:metallo-beta-lactamase family protein
MHTDPATMGTGLFSFGPAPRVTFWGAAQSVTGSMHLVEANGQHILLDCGLIRDRHHHAHGGPFPFVPADIDAVVLSHAHIDHCGHLPALVRHGFRGPIYCTGPTRELVTVMLANSARHHEEDAYALQVIGRSPPTQAQPVFTGNDVRQTLSQCAALE